MHVCDAHGQVPASTPEENHICYGELFECTGCKRNVCWGYGAADDTPDLCDSCHLELTIQ